MRIALCDDDSREWEEFMKALHGWAPDKNAECFADGDALLKAAKEKPPFTVAFLDIYMPGEEGMETARRLAEISPDTELVFVTASREHAVQAFEIGALHYLVKPVTEEGIREVFSRIAQRQSRQQPAVWVKTGRGQRRICLGDIRSLTSSDHYTNIVLENGETVPVLMSLKEMQSQMDGRFLKLQRGLVVNMEYIEMMQSDSCRLRNGETILLSRKERVRIREAYNNWVFSRLPSG